MGSRREMIPCGRHTIFLTQAVRENITEEERERGGRREMIGCMLDSNIVHACVFKISKFCC